MRTLTFTFPMLHEVITVSISRRKETSARAGQESRQTTAQGANWPELIGIR